MKPLGQKNYGSIPHIQGSRTGETDSTINIGQQRIATEKARDKKDLIIVQEKLDGANVGVAKIDGKIIALTRNGSICSESRFQVHRDFDMFVFTNWQRFDSLLNDGERLCGEYLRHAVGTRYKLPHEPFVPFDIIEGNVRETYHNFLLRVLPFGFTVPRLIHIGQPYPLRQVLKDIEVSGHGAIDPVEGAVWRVEREGRVDFLCKYVRHDKEDGKYFAEKNGGIITYNSYK